MQLNSVVLPAPFGPIRPQIAPRATLKLTSCRAVTPPKRIVTPSTASRAEFVTPLLSGLGFRLGQLHGPSVPRRRSFEPTLRSTVSTFPRGLVTCFVEASHAAHGRRSRKASTPALKALSPTARLWSRPGMSSASAFGIIAASLCAIARDVVARADRDQRRDRDRRHALLADRLARAADAGGERLAVALRLLGEGAEHALHRVGEIGERGRLHRVGDPDRQARRRAPAGRQARRGRASGRDAGRPSARKAEIRAPIE